MNASDALSIIYDIEATGARAEKQRLLDLLVADDYGKWIIRWTYDPLITFGITPPRQPSSGSTNVDLRPALIDDLLDRLATRKLTGNAAQAEVAEVMEALNPASAELLFRMLSKDLKCGIAESTINTVIPGLVPVFSVMRAHAYEPKRVKSWPQVVEPKLDGFRFTFLCRDGKGGFFTRSGKRAPAADHLVQPMIDTALAALGKSDDRVLWSTLSTRPHDLARYAYQDLNFMVDGEMIAGTTFNETSGALRRGTGTANDATFHIFDLMSFADFDATGSVGRPYLERRALVEEFVRYAVTPAITKTPRYFVNSDAEIQELFESFRSRGLEGAMVKIVTGLYDKKKTFGWMKLKAEETEDLPVIGAFPGEPHTKYENCLGGLIVDRNGVQVRVGGGFTDVERIELWKLWLDDQALMNSAPELMKVEAQLVGRLIECEFHEVTPDGSLRHPRFVRFRDDKAGEIQDKEAA